MDVLYELMYVVHFTWCCYKLTMFAKYTLTIQILKLSNKIVKKKNKHTNLNIFIRKQLVFLVQFTVQQQMIILIQTATRGVD